MLDQDNRFSHQQLLVCNHQNVISFKLVITIDQEFDQFLTSKDLLVGAFLRLTLVVY